jgi:phosphomannomutase
VDRAGAVLSDGSELNRNRIIAMLAAILLREHPGTTIVTDSITSTGLAKFIEEKGGIHHRFKRGYRNVINESIRLNAQGQDSQLAIETSGHGALKENYFLDDGAYLVTRLLVKMAKLKKDGKKLRDLIADLKLPAESKEIRMGFKADVDFKVYGKNVLDELKDYSEKNGWTLAPSNYEGIRISFGSGEGDGWFLLRMSLHDPIMPLNIESNVNGGNLVIAKKLYDFLKGYDGLVIDNLTAFIG